MTFQNILVPTDFSEPAEEAAMLATELAGRFGSKITLLHVYEIPPVYGYEAALAWPAEEYEKLASEELDAELKKVSALCPRVESVLFTGRIIDRILAVVKDREIDLVVMGTHGRRGLAHAFLGSVAEKVVRRSPVPVLTVGPRSAEEPAHQR